MRDLMRTATPIMLMMIAVAGCGTVGGPADAAAVDAAVDAAADARPEDAQDAAIDGPDAPPERLAQVAAGHGVTCGVTTAGRVLCWGANEFGQLGVAPTATPTMCQEYNRMAPCRSTPTAVAGVSDAVAVSVGFNHVCAVTRDGRVWCWGRNDQGQLGHDPATDAMCGGLRCAPTPTAVSNLSGVAEVVVAGDHTCARTTAGAVRCWGNNLEGTLGNGTFGGWTATPVNAVGLSTGVTRLAGAGWGHTTCAIKDGEVYCWGVHYAEGNLGFPQGSTVCSSTGCAPTPTRIAGLTGAIDLAIGERVGCVTITGGTVRCWGSNLFGQLGRGASEPSGYQHREVPGLTQVVELSGSMVVTCARTQAGAVRCWGAASVGGIGDGNASGAACTLDPCRPTPTAVPLPRPAAALGVGSSTFALDDGGGAFAWGSNGLGQLGHAPGTAGDTTCGSAACAVTPTTLAAP
jgi:alpha-tubulin suppressor-like RCC1 family protein